MIMKSNYVLSKDGGLCSALRLAFWGGCDCFYNGYACSMLKLASWANRIGGDTISVTSGVVSRIEVTSYVHGSTELLGVQIDAAINSGNSGAHGHASRSSSFTFLRTLALWPLWCTCVLIASLLYSSGLTLSPWLAGGPVFNDRGQCCGIAFQSLAGSDAENIGALFSHQVLRVRFCITR